MKKAYLVAAALGLCSLSASAIATNYVLRLQPDASVQCGRMQHIEGLGSYTLQLWFNADSWTPGANLIELGSGCALQLGPSGQLQFTTTGGNVAISHADLLPGNWIHLTLISDNGSGRAYINGNEVVLGNLPQLPADNSALRLGGGLSGRLDEVRIWSAALQQAQFDHFRNNTLNRWNPQIADLAAYYKMDQTGCDNIVDYTDLWPQTKRQTNNHGVITGTATREVNDNPLMRYRLNGAYTANERFFDRQVSAEQYQLSNDLIILGIESFTDGHLDYVTRNNHATAVNGVEFMDQFQGRSGVASFDGSASMTFAEGTFTPEGTGYAFETFLYIDQWVPGAEIFAKRSADDTQGLRVRLGDEATKELLIECNGNHYALINKLQTGKWHHIGIQPDGTATDARFTFTFYLDGVNELPSRKASSTTIDREPLFPAGCTVSVGRNFKGKLDNLTLWHAAQLSAGLCTRHINQGLDLPGIGKTQAAGYMKTAELGLEFNSADDLGFDSYSQDNWLRVIRSAYDGMSGYEVRISVKSHSGWENTINDANRRRIFAQDLARLSQGYDGVELDLEWEYGTQSRLGALAAEIRAALPADKSFMISEHNVASGFPKDKMQHVDGFTFQQYGPQKTHFFWSSFVNYCKGFVSYGFPKDKIITSYSTTTSVGHQNGAANNSRPIKGIKDGFLDGYTPDFTADSECRNFDGFNYYFTSPAQTYRRARYTVEQDFGGIFYWDMGNDLPASHEYNAARWCSYGLNSNVEPSVTRVDLNHNSSVAEVAADRQALKVEANCSGSYLTVSANAQVQSVTVTDLGGRRIATANGTQLTLDALSPGAYVATVTTDLGTASVKFVK